MTDGITGGAMRVSKLLFIPGGFVLLPRAMALTGFFEFGIS
jgi:hypothetical protein